MQEVVVKGRRGSQLKTLAPPAVRQQSPITHLELNISQQMSARRISQAACDGRKRSPPTSRIDTNISDHRRQPRQRPHHARAGACTFAANGLSVNPHRQGESGEGRWHLIAKIVT